MEYLSVIKNKWISVICDNVARPFYIQCSKQTQKVKCHMLSHGQVQKYIIQKE